MILIVGEFSLDQMLPEHVAKIDPLILTQHLQYSSYKHGEILDLVLIFQILVLFFLCHQPTVIALLFAQI